MLQLEPRVHEVDHPQYVEHHHVRFLSHASVLTQGKGKANGDMDHDDEDSVDG